jgi:GntR family transcriptional regulator, transcriptional repressor for pyruvate dehydrogenase complex
MAALTDQAIAKIKDLIISGEFAAGAKLPKEQVLAKRLCLSRNSLREAVRALALIGVVEPRVGDGTYVTSLEPELLLTGMGFVSDLLTGPTLLELHQVRRVLEPVATGMAATRMTDADFADLEQCLAEMDAAETTQAFIAADQEFHRIIVAASGNATLASLIQNLSGGTLRARLWRSVTEQDAVETTKRRHWDIYRALRSRDAEQASAADMIHLAEGEYWLRKLTEDEQAIVLAPADADPDAEADAETGAGADAEAQGDPDDPAANGAKRLDGDGLAH